MSYAIADDGLKLHFDDRGSGPAVLCLPGLTRNMADFDPVLPLFEGRARVIRLDFRGRGGSDWAEDFTTYTIPQEANDVIALLDHLDLPRVAILGTSRGGLVAMWLAALARDRLNGVFFNDIGPVVEPAGLTAIMGYLGKRPSYRDFEAAAADMPAQHPGFTGVTDEQWARYVRRLWIETEDGLDICYDPKLRDAVADAFDPSKEPPDLWPLFDALEGAPLGLAWGKASNILSAATVAEMSKRRADMHLAELPDRGHVPFLDEPASKAALSDWLDRLR